MFKDTIIIIVMAVRKPDLAMIFILSEWKHCRACKISPIQKPHPMCLGSCSSRYVSCRLDRLEIILKIEGAIGT